MPVSKNENTFSSTYKDDFSEGDNYQRILFNSGRALQARELTQLQTIIQKQMERFGRNIFKEGSVVIPGGLLVDDQIQYVRLQGTPTLYAGDILTESGTGIKARVIDFIAAVDSDPATVYVDYIDRGTTGGGATSIAFSSTGVLSNGNESGSGGTGTVTVNDAGTDPLPVTGKGFKIAVNDGAYFIRGMFVQTQAQSKIISKYSNTPTTNIGFLITEDIVTVDDTNALYDNQNDLPNETAPGADRYRIRLTLAAQSEDIIDSDTNFIITNRLLNGVLQQEIDENTYNIIGDELATRTFEESGNYAVKSFTPKFKPKDADEFTLDVSSGIAYVNGYRVSKPENTLIDVNRSQTTTGALSDENIAANFGHFINVNNIKGVPNLSTYETWNLYDDSGLTIGGSGSILGTARIRQVVEDGANYRYHLFDVNMTDDNNFRDVKSIGQDSANRANLILENNNAVIKEANNNNVFFALPRVRPNQSNGVDVSGLTVQKRFSLTSTAGGEIVLNRGDELGNTEDGANAVSWIIATDSASNPTGTILNKTPTIDTTANTVTYTGLAPSTQHEILGYIARGSAAGHKTKTLQTDGDETFLAAAIESDGDGLRFFTLSEYDIYSFDSVVDASNVSIFNRYITDNGQRDNFYDRGRLILKSGQSVPASTRVYYKYFEHGATGDFFSVNSYAGNSINYEDYPKHRMRNGAEVELRNVLDFRSKKDASGDFTGSGAYVHALPSNTDIITADVDYYQSRKDVLVVNSEGDLVYIEGNPGTNPVRPEVPSNAMTIANFSLNPYTDDVSDLTTTLSNNRRYTMRDIGGIVERIDDLEEAVTLNLLELETSTLEVLDANGNSRFKNGFFADNFKDLVFSDIFADQYSAGFDIDENTITPLGIQNNVRMRYNKDHASSTNTIQKGDLVFLNYTEVNEINQDLATETENVNPFDVILYNGTLVVSPETDQWREFRVVETVTSTREAARSEARRREIINRIVRPSEFVTAADLGVDEFTIGVGDLLGGVVQRNRRRRGSDELLLGGEQGFVRQETIARFPSSVRIRRTVRTIFASIVADLTLLPFVRSRKVFFRAEGLAPKREHFLYFDRTPIKDYAREETFRRFTDSADLDDYTDGDYSGATSHPQSSSTLVSNEFGEIEGSFFIPNNDTLQFDAGERRVVIHDLDQTAANYSETAPLSIAATVYSAQGIRADVINLQETTTTIISRTTRKEPIAQSFQIQNSNGGFITSVEVFFATTPNSINANGDNDTNDNTPITLQIRPVQSGVPSQDTIVPGAEKVLQPSECSVTPQTTTVTIADIRNNPTKFEFDAPVYLQGNTEYAIVLIANTQNYNVYVSKIQDFVIGSTDRRVTKQPSLGSFFMSQNAITWTPDQLRDMMFKVNRADFSTSGTAVFENRAVPSVTPRFDPISTISGDSDVTILLENSGFVKNDKVFISGLDSSTRYGGILGSTLIGEQTVKKVDGKSFQITVDSAATETALSGGTSLQTERNVLMDEFLANINTFFPADATTMSTGAEFTGGVSLVTANNVTNNAYTELSSVNIVPYRLTRFESPRVIASARIEEDEFTGPSAGRKSVTFTSSLATTDAYISPVVDLQTLSISSVSNFIDNQTADSATAAEPNTTFNNPIDFVADSAANSGSSLSKHITIPINLEEPAVGLKVLLGANRPSGSFIDLYYRTLPAGSDTDIETVKFILATEDTSIQTDDNRNIFRQYEYTIGGQAGTLTPFSTFQLKIVFRSQNSSRVPRIKDLRAIALGT